MKTEDGASLSLTLYAARQEVRAVQLKLQRASDSYQTEPEQRQMLERASQSARLASIALQEAISALNVEFSIDTEALVAASEAREEARGVQVLAEKGPLIPPVGGLWWLSFCDASLPEGEQFIGVAIVPGYDIVSAAKAAHITGCNPGGEVMGRPVPEEIAPLIRDSDIGRLLDRAETERVDRAIHLATGHEYTGSVDLNEMHGDLS